jgi:hypothetical protein
MHEYSTVDIRFFKEERYNIAMNEKESITVSASAIEEYNYMIQAEKPEEDKQFSFEKLGIEDWRIEVLTGRELMELGNFVETSGERSDSLLL